MVSRLAILCLGASLLSACATVDVSQIAQNENVTVQPDPNKPNIVVRATSRLYSAFKNHGWVEGAGNQMAKVSEFLLRGRDGQAKDAKENSYAMRVESVSEVREDIVTATQYVQQTKRAADVYLEFTPKDTDLSEELQSLEQALKACREAEISLSAALDRFPGGNAEIELAPIKSEVELLRSVTDVYGERVRSKSSAVDQKRNRLLAKTSYSKNGLAP